MNARFRFFLVIACAAALAAAGRVTAGAGPRPQRGGGTVPPPRIPHIRPDNRLVVPVRLPSEASPEGIRMALIAPMEPRYEDGAPVVVRVPPPLGASLPPTRDVLGLTALGFVLVEFQYPPGESFDAGGPNCKRALADVLLFAMGKKASSEKQKINQVLSVPVRTDAVGALGMSHGGNAVVTTLESYPEELQDLAFYVSYESPCGTGPDRLGDSVTVDGGSISADPDPFTDADGNGLPWDDGRNPFYSPGSGVDYSVLAWDAKARTLLRGAGPRPTNGVLFLDGNGNGKVDAGKVRLRPAGEGRPGGQGPKPPERVTTDLNKNGMIDPTEDFLLGCLPRAFNRSYKRVYSLAATRAAARSIFRNGFPSLVATPPEAREFWSERDMAAGFEKLGGAFSDLLVCIYAGRHDHVQAQPDYPHIRAQYRGLLQAGVEWVRINPSPVYVRKFFGVKDMKLPANLPGEELTPENVAEKTMPARREIGHLLLTAGLAEMADRAASGERSRSLNSVLFPDAPAVSINIPEVFWFTGLPEKPSAGS